MQSPVLYDPVRAPRFPIVLCHGTLAIWHAKQIIYSNSTQGYTASTSAAHRACVCSTGRPSLASSVRSSVQRSSSPRCLAPGRSPHARNSSTGSCKPRPLGVGSTLWHTRWAGSTVAISSRISNLSSTRHCHSPPLRRHTVGVPLWTGVRYGFVYFFFFYAAFIRIQEYLGLGRRRPEDDETKSSMTIMRHTTIDTAERSPSTTLRVSFSSLPSSFTTLLLSLFDSPAYANLTTSYLTETFNPRTPDDPRVRYFSIAGRMTALNIWHPLWFPKVVLDSVTAAGTGNDGLVSVDSARWGEFLGTLEGADHWALRGASGIELDVDLPDAWIDWGRRKDALKSSTDRLSAVVDWLVEQVPVASRGTLATADTGSSSSSHWQSSPPAAPKPRGDLESVRDLERLYVALARKLYDEGL